MRDLFSLDGKTAVVTGSGQGLGKAIALGLADYGADVVVCEINADLAAVTAKEIKSKGRRTMVSVTDVRDGKQVNDMVTRSMDEFGKINILVNVAGGNASGFGPILELSEEGWDSEFALNAKSTFLCCKAVAKAMVSKKTKGSLINFSSISGFSNRPDSIAYGAAKGAIRLFTDGMAKAMARYGVRVNAIAPGYFATPLPAKVYAANPKLREQRAKMIPMGRIADPSEMVGLAVYLASDASSFLTGQTILISGGLDTLLVPQD